MEINRTLSRLKNSVEEALTPIIRKGENLTPADLENATKAICLLESVKRIESMPQNEEGYSERMSNSNRPYRSYDMPPYYDGYSSRRSNTFSPYCEENARRYYDGRSNDNYSGHSIKDRMIDQLEKMFDEAKTEHERQVVQEWIDRLSRG